MSAQPIDAAGAQEYWDERYATVGPSNVSWFQHSPDVSLDLIAQVADHSHSVIDVGGGASTLVDHLLERGFRDITVIDVSQQALLTARERTGEAPVHWVVEDVREWEPDRTFDVWHDRAAYHFLTDARDQQHYWALVREAVPPGGHVILATFADDGPTMCSGLPVTRNSPAQLVEQMGEGFTLVTSRREEHVTPTGAVQPFTWVVSTRN